MSKTKPVPTGYKASDVSLRRDNGEVVTKDGKVWILRNSVWLDATYIDGEGKARATVTDDTKGQSSAQEGTNDIPPTTVNTPNGPIVTEHEDVVTKLRTEHPKLNEHLANSDEEHRRKDEELARLKAENAELKASRRGEHEGKPAGGRDAPTTHGVRMAGKYPHKTEDMPTVDQLNDAGKAK